MYKVSELISKPLISVYGAKECGTIANIYFDAKFKRGKLLKVLSDDENDAEIKFIELRKVSSLKHDAATVKNCDAITFEWNTAINNDELNINPINSEVFNQDGKLLGVLKDITLDETAVISFTVNETEYPAACFLAQSEKLMIFNDSGKPIKVSKPNGVPKPKDSGANAKITDFNNLQNDGAVINSLNNSAQIELPVKIPPLGSMNPLSKPQQSASEKYAFLMGKVLTKSIYNNRRILLPADTIIDQRVIDLARNNGKIVQLALHASALENIK